QKDPEDEYWENRSGRGIHRRGRSLGQRAARQVAEEQRGSAGTGRETRRGSREPLPRTEAWRPLQGPAPPPGDAALGQTGQAQEAGLACRAVLLADRRRSRGRRAP